MAGIDGANQAQVMNAMEAHLGDQDWSELQMKVRIAPITTIPDRGSDHLQIVQADAARIHDQLDQEVRRFRLARKQTTVQPKERRVPLQYGGGVSGILPAEVERAIQDGLKSLAAAYPAPS